jgi:hypothetical protein
MRADQSRTRPSDSRVGFDVELCQRRGLFDDGWRRQDRMDVWPSRFAMVARVTVPVPAKNLVDVGAIGLADGVQQPLVAMTSVLMSVWRCADVPYVHVRPCTSRSSRCPINCRCCNGHDRLGSA